MDYAPVIGFEVHVELGTASKMFCGCPANHFGVPPNTQTCPVCLGLPGALPVPNQKAIEWTVKLGLALGCQVNLFSKFDRKNYFYPDLSKSYQISQYDLPFCEKGQLTLPSGKTIRITRVHLEEDTGKLQHATVNEDKVTLIDFNRSGVPLVEIVTEPDFDNADDGVEFLKEIQQIVRAIGISAADMEKGSMRLEANVSVKPRDQKGLPKYKVELKNINSFRFIKKAIDYDVKRQIDILEKGETPTQETRGFSESTNKTFSQRSKEEANDYRYFPEPDIPPITLTSQQIDSWKKDTPRLPAQIRNSLLNLGIPPISTATISQNPEYLKLLTEAVALDPQTPPVEYAHLLVNKRYGDVLPTSAQALVELKYSQAKIGVDQEVLKNIIAQVILENPSVVEDYKAGKTQVIGFLIGKANNLLEGKGDPREIRERLLQLLNQ